jgi:hypothetical protein
MDIFKVNNTKSWANMANESSERKRKVRHATRRARGEASRTPTPKKRYVAPKPASPASGNTRGTGDKMMIYTKKPVILANGRQLRGHWTRAVDPEGDYGGPYANMRNLLANPRYRSNMNEFEKDRANYQKFVRNMQSRVAGSPGFNRLKARQTLRAMGITRKRSGSRSRSRSHK